MLQVWLWLLVAFIVGVLLEWLLEIFFFRRRFLQQTQEKVLSVERSKQDLQTKIATLQAALAARDTDLDNLKAQIAQAQSERDACVSAQIALDQDVESLRVQLAKSTGELGVSLAANAELEKQVSALKAQLSKANCDRDAALKEKAARAAEAQTRQTQLTQARADLAECQKRSGDLSAEIQKLQASSAATAERIKLLEGDQARQRTQIEKLMSDLLQVASQRDRLGTEITQLRAQPPVAIAPAPTIQQLRQRSADDETPFTAACPQHLSDVEGIGAVYETRLYEAGIGSYWELAQLSNADLQRILQVTELQSAQIDFNAIRADARRLARETKSLGRQWSRGKPDDFEPLQGIGATYEKRLYDAGICTYAALANATVELLEEICHAPAQFKPDYALWIKQAKELAAKKADQQRASGGGDVSQ
ncbi:MAG: helix-hairpin-helix domain-containing protein [Chloroflexota bacterium]